MSYILEALRRAERERDLGKPPSVESLSRPQGPATARAPRGVWLLAGATMLVALAALGMLLWRQVPAAAPKTNAAPPPVQAAAASVAPPPTVTAPASAATSDALSAGAATAIEDRDTLVSLDDLTQWNPAGLQAPPAADSQQTGTSGPAERADAQPPPAQPPQTANAQPEAAVRELQSIPLPAAGPPGVTPLHDMPAAYREQFPVTSLDVHVYDPEPARRWVMIGGKRYHEYDVLDSGPAIAQITEAGVVFDYGGSRVLLPVR